MHNSNDPDRAPHSAENTNQEPLMVHDQPSAPMIQPPASAPHYSLQPHQMFPQTHQYMPQQQAVPHQAYQQQQFAHQHQYIPQQQQYLPQQHVMPAYSVNLNRAPASFKKGSNFNQLSLTECKLAGGPWCDEELSPIPQGDVARDAVLMSVASQPNIRTGVMGNYVSACVAIQMMRANASEVRFGGSSQVGTAKEKTSAFVAAFCPFPCLVHRRLQFETFEGLPVASYDRPGACVPSGTVHQSVGGDFVVEGTCCGLIQGGACCAAVQVRDSFNPAMDYTFESSCCQCGRLCPCPCANLEYDVVHTRSRRNVGKFTRQRSCCQTLYCATVQGELMITSNISVEERKRLFLASSVLHTVNVFE